MTRLFDITSGKIEFEGNDISKLSRKAMRPFRRDIQMIFQDPYGSLNPRRRVGSIIGDPLAIHGISSGQERKRAVQETMELVGLNPEHFNRFPAEFSGGQRQRIGVARALVLRPKLIVCDEPVSALDVSIQAQIINLLDDLQDELGLTYLFIAHDLSVVRHVSDRVAVMYLGQIIEEAPGAGLYNRSRHPYSRALLSAVPVPDPASARTRERIILVGDVPSPIDPPHGCRFHPRCPKAAQLCVDEEPQLIAALRRPAGPRGRAATSRSPTARTWPTPSRRSRRQSASCRSPGRSTQGPHHDQAATRWGPRHEEDAVTQGINDAIGAGDSGQILEVLDPGMPNTKVIEGRSPFALAFDRLRRDRGAMISLYLIIAIVVIAIFAPIFAAITGHGVDTQYRGLDALSPAGAPHAPSSNFWFGTDDQGRDLLVRTAYGARASLEVGISATALTMLIGVTVGLFAGYYGGWSTSCWPASSTSSCRCPTCCSPSRSSRCSATSASGSSSRSSRRSAGPASPASSAAR